MTLAVPGPGGSVAPGYGRVRDAFARAAGGGASAFAAEVDGERVCDLWAGDGFGGDSATVLYSGTKGVVATALLLLVERGELDLDAPVSSLWPEFAARGKGAVTVTDLLAHGAGLPAVERPLERADLGRPRFLAAELAAQAPLVPPGAPTYHAVTWGWLAGELVLRASGLTAGAYVREHLAGPLRHRPADRACARRSAGGGAWYGRAPPRLPADGVHGGGAGSAADARLRQPGASRSRTGPIPICVPSRRRP